MNKLDRKLIESETNIIMNRVYQLNDKKKLQFKKILYPAFSLILIIVFILSFAYRNQSKNDLVLAKINKEDYQFYRLRNKDSSLNININVFVENEELIKFNDDVSYYSNFTKYINVSEKSNLEIIQITDKDFLKLTIDNRIYKYFYIFKTKSTILLFDLDNNFTNFETEMNRILDLMEKYPPSINDVNYNENPNHVPYYYKQYTENPKAKQELDKDSYELYSWYVKRLDQISLYKPESETSNGFITNIYLDGNIDNLGNIKDIEYVYISTDSDVNKNDIYEFPTKINNCPIGKVKTSLGDIKIFYEYASFQCTNDTYKDSAITSMIIDFSKYTDYLKLSDYDIHITLRGNKEDYIVPENYFLVNGNILYVMPVPYKFEEGKTGVTIQAKVIIKDKKGNILFNENPAYIPVYQWDNPYYKSK